MQYSLRKAILAVFLTLAVAEVVVFSSPSLRAQTFGWSFLQDFFSMFSVGDTNTATSEALSGDHEEATSTLWDGLGHAISRSVSWPTDHYADVSWTWSDGNHAKQASASWPSDHTFDHTQIWEGGGHTVSNSTQWPPDHIFTYSIQGRPTPPPGSDPAISEFN